MEGHEDLYAKRERVLNLMKAHEQTLLSVVQMLSSSPELLSAYRTICIILDKHLHETLHAIDCLIWRIRRWNAHERYYLLQNSG